MNEFNPYFTADGSVGLYSKEFNDIYHSATGALTEAYQKFVYPLDFNKLFCKKTINVLDICYGIGYNTNAFLNHFQNYLETNFYNKENFQKLENKNISMLKNNIETIDANKNIDTSIDKICGNNVNKTCNEIFNRATCNDALYANKLLPKIVINAVDIDSVLFALSPFIVTGEEDFKKYNNDISIEKVVKYLSNSDNQKNIKNEKFINFIILLNIYKKSPELFDNDDFKIILNNQENAPYFMSDVRAIFKELFNNRHIYNSYNNNSAFLHNIYYKYISNKNKIDLYTYLLENVDFNCYIYDVRKFIKNDATKYHLVFLDAFTPSKCPCLWSVDFFKVLYNHLSDDGIILTYSTSASVRAAMLENNFYIGNIIHEDKCIGTICAKDKSLIKNELTEYEFGLLKTRAGIFYRDENLSAENEAIINRRKIEVENSNLLSTSQYKKQFLNF